MSIWHIKKSRNRNNNSKSEIKDKDPEKYFKTKHGLKILYDKFIEDIKDDIYNLIVCCGGHPNSVILDKNEL